MSFLDKVREGFKQSSEKVYAVTEELVKRGKKVGSEGLEVTKEMVAEIGEKATEIASLAKIKYEITSLKNQRNEMYLKLGKECLALHQGQKSISEDPAVQESLKTIEQLNEKLEKQQKAYEQQKKINSGSVVVNKLSEELASADAVVEQVVVVAQADVVDKLIKEINFPGEVLLAAIKREENTLIPDGNTQLKAADQVTLIGKKDEVNAIVKRLKADIEL